MNIRVHLPDSEEGWQMLNDRMAEFHAGVILDQINNLPCGYEEKLEVLEGVKRRIEEESYESH